MAAILQNGCLETIISQPSNNVEYENYTFLERLWHNQSEKQYCHLPRVLYSRHFTNLLP